MQGKQTSHGDSTMSVTQLHTASDCLEFFSALARLSIEYVDHASPFPGERGQLLGVLYSSFQTGTDSSHNCSSRTSRSGPHADSTSHRAHRMTDHYSGLIIRMPSKATGRGSLYTLSEGCSSTNKVVIVPSCHGSSILSIHMNRLAKIQHQARTQNPD